MRELCCTLKLKSYEYTTTPKRNLPQRIPQPREPVTQALFRGICLVLLRDVPGGVVCLYFQVVHGIPLRLGVFLPWHAEVVLARIFIFFLACRH
jgi:hypothetical protein